MKAPSWIIAAVVVLVGAFLCLVSLQVSTLVTDTDQIIRVKNSELTISIERLNAALDNLDRATAKAPHILDDVHTTFKNINRKCSGPAGPDACGTLAQLNKTTIQLGDAFKTTQLQVQQSQHILDETSLQLASVAKHVNKNMDTITFHSVAALDAAQKLIVGGQPLLEDTHKILSNPAIPDLFDSARSISKNGDHIVFTFDAVSTKATHNYLHPSKNPLKRAWDVSSPFVYPIVRIGASTAPAW